jgi:hypothetical protein
MHSRITILLFAVLVGSCASVPSGTIARSEVALQDAAAPTASAATQSMLFITTSSTDSPNRAVLTFDFAVIAREKGHDVSVFLAGDATMLMKEGVRSTIHAPGQPSANELIARARELGIRVLV